MKDVYKYFFCSLIFSFSSMTFCQIDDSSIGNKKGNFSFENIGISSKEAKKPQSLNFENDNGFKTAHKKQQEALKKKQQKEAYLSKGILTPAIRRKIVLQKKIEQYNIKIPQADLDLGSFRTTSEKINISALDFGKVDGDVISVYRNGELIVNNYTLTEKSSILSVPLELGINRIEIIALNEGLLMPNTGAFTLFDDSDEIALSNMWNLAKGAKVISIIIREEKK